MSIGQSGLWWRMVLTRYISLPSTSTQDVKPSTGQSRCPRGAARRARPSATTPTSAVPIGPFDFAPKNRPRPIAASARCRGDGGISDHAIAISKSAAQAKSM